MSQPLPTYRYPLFRLDMPGLDDLRTPLADIWRRGWFTNNGPVARAYEAAVARFYHCDPEQVVTTCNATTGLLLAARTVLEQGHTAWVPAFTFPPTVQALRWSGIPYKYGDIRADSLELDLQIALVQTALRNLMITAPLGCWSDVQSDTMRYFGGVVLDAAASLGRFMPRALVWADVIVFSLHATKPLGACEGGVLICKTKQLADEIRQRANFGLDEFGQVEYPYGLNGKLDEINAAIALHKLAWRDRVFERAEILGELYKRELRGADFYSPVYDGLQQPLNFFPVYVDHALEVEAALKRRGILSRRYYQALHKMRVEACDYTPPSLPVTEAVASKILVLPMHTNFRCKDIEFIVHALVEVREELAKREARKLT